MDIIEVNHATKEFHLGQLTSMKNSVVNMLNRLRSKQVEILKPFRALEDITFSVRRGEVLGIIGHNGAGKSTLLKLLANVSVPTRGSVSVKGKVNPLIEVGAGLVPELTGRENIYVNGSILGMTRKELDRKFEDMVAFAELEEFIDTPIKRYSSGMKVRLGFAIATSIESDILIVDEVLAVGDLAFQRKCFERMEEIIKRQGRTVLLVSHNIRQVERLCTRVLLMDHGKITADGDPLFVTDLFYRQSNERVDNYHKASQLKKTKIDSTGEVELVKIEVTNELGQLSEAIPSGGTLRVRLRLAFNRAMERPEIIVGTHTTDFFYLSASSTATLANQPDLAAGIHDIEYIVPSFPLVAGTYCVRCAIFDQNRRAIFDGESLCTFRVTPPPLEVREPPVRNLSLPTKWRVDGVGYDTMVVPHLDRVTG